MIFSTKIYSIDEWFFCASYLEYTIYYEPWYLKTCKSGGIKADIEFTMIDLMIER